MYSIIQMFHHAWHKQKNETADQHTKWAASTNSRHTRKEIPTLPPPHWNREEKKLHNVSILPVEEQQNWDGSEQGSSDTIKTSNHPLSRMLEPKCHTNASSKWFLFFRKFSTIFGILYQGILFFLSAKTTTANESRQQPKIDNSQVERIFQKISTKKPTIVSA